MAGNTWGNWRVNLPTHTGDLQPTDLIECTSIVGGVPVNSVITGQQIIDAAHGGGGVAWGNITGTLSTQTDLQSALNAKQATLVSGTNIKTVNGNSLVGSGNVNVSPYTLIGNSSGASFGNSTLNTQNCSQIIPANTLADLEVLQIKTKIQKTVGSTATNFRMYINTSNSLTGATLLASCSAITTAQIARFEREVLLSGNNLYTINSAQLVATDIAGNTLTFIPFIPSNTYYIIFAIQHSGTSDFGRYWKTNVMKYG